MRCIRVVILGARFRAVKEQAWSPPRGWNSYDSFCWTVSEEEFLQNARLVAQRLHTHGYKVLKLFFAVTEHDESF